MQIRGMENELKINMGENNRQKGFEEEALAAKYLQSCGYRIIDRNFYCSSGEIDIIAVEDEYMCFVEVKFRSSSRDGYPTEAVDIRKMKRIINASRVYLYMKGKDEFTPCRYDVVSILGNKCELIRNAFDLM